MNFDLKALIRRKADLAQEPDALAETAEPAGPQEERGGGKGRKSVETPYLNARRTWNAHEGALVASRRAWQIMGILALLITLAAVGGLIQIGSQSRFIPYVIEIDKLGQAVAVAPAQQAAAVDKRVLHATVAQFIADARLVTTDMALQKKAVFRTYAYLAPKDPATAKMTEWWNATEESSPFRRAAKEMVSTEILSVIPQTPDTWQVEWKETTRDREGVMQGDPVRMRALVTVYTVPPSPDTTEEKIRNNPLGVFIRDFSWAPQR